MLITKTVRGLLSESSCPVRFMLRAIELDLQRGLDPLATESSLACCSWDMSAGVSAPATESFSTCCSWDMSAGVSIHWPLSLPQRVVAGTCLLGSQSTGH